MQLLESQRQRRVRGAVLVVVGLGVVVPVLAYVDLEWGWGSPTRLLNGLFVTAASFAVLGAGMFVASFLRGASRMSARALRERIAREPVPFRLCLRCHTFADRDAIDRCLECNSNVDCLEVASEGDRRTALTALGR